MVHGAEFCRDAQTSFGLWSKKLYSYIMQCFPFHQCSLVQPKHQTHTALPLQPSCVLSSGWAAVAVCSAIWAGLNFTGPCSTVNCSSLTSSASEDSSVCLWELLASTFFGWISFSLVIWRVCHQCTLWYFSFLKICQSTEACHFCRTGLQY